MVGKRGDFGRKCFLIENSVIINSKKELIKFIYL